MVIFSIETISNAFPEASDQFIFVRSNIQGTTRIVHLQHEEEEEEVEEESR